MINNQSDISSSRDTSAIRIESIDAIRSRLVNTSIFVSLTTACFALVASICRAIFVDGQDLAFMQCGLFLVGVVFTIFYRRLSYLLRALLVPGALFVVGVTDLWRWGLMGMGIPLLITSCILVTIFFGGRSGLVAFATSLAVILLTGIGIQLGQISFEFDMDAYATSPFFWTTAVLGFCYFLGLVVTILIRLHASLNNIIDELNQRTSELQRTNEQLNSEIIERKQAENTLKRNMEAFQLHSDLASTLIKTPTSELGETIELFLRRIVEFFGVDRANLIYRPEADKKSHEIYCWNREGVNPFKLPSTYDKFSYLNKILTSGGIFSFSKINELPPEAESEKDYFRNEGIESAIIIPMMVEGKVLGLLNFSSFRSQQLWSDALVRQFQLIGQTFTHSLERKHAEELLRENEDKLRAIFENINDEIVYLDAQGTVLDVNKRIEDVSGYKPEEVIGKHVSEIDFFRPDSSETLMGLYKKGIAGNLRNLTEVVGRKKNGAEVIVESSNSVIKKGGKIKNIVVVVRDITERKKLEAQLQQAQKMEAIGTLAGGVAHDLNNILSGVVSYPELLLMNLSEDDPLRKPLLTIKKSGEKAAGIVNDLLTLARRGVVVTEVVDLDNVVSEYLESPEHEKLRSYHPHIEIETNFEADLPPILGSPVHLSKTIMNLVSNAAEAMAEGGNIFISTEYCYLDRPVRGYNDIEEGDYVALRVSDTGEGISFQDLGRIFEPFYTKKVMGRSGTGLGMSVVWGTVKDHKGYIDIKTTEGKGTTCTLYFPVTRKERIKDDAKSSIENYMSKGESILVVDDVEEQREIASEMLRELGYFVTSVPSGEQAVDYVKNHSADLLVLDMIMDPGIDGLETYKRILKTHPRQKAIIASGFSETEHVKEAQRLGAGKYVKKPYTLEQLALAARTEIEK